MINSAISEQFLRKQTLEKLKSCNRRGCKLSNRNCAESLLCDALAGEVGEEKLAGMPASRNKLRAFVQAAGLWVLDDSKFLRNAEPTRL